MILVLNAGSSSIKLALFDGADEVGRTAVDRIGAGGPGDHAAALAIGLEQLGTQAVTAAAHRVVHGGVALTQTCRITDAVEAEITRLSTLAPLHNPPALAGIAAVRARWPDLPQFAAFDTAFHATNPAVATAYALPAAIRAEGLRRYGFHGLNYAAVWRRLNECGLASRARRLLVFHLGNGASACAMVGGVSVATSMGYSPLDGLTMGTRTGQIDGNAVLRLATDHGIEGAGRILNRESGLLGLGGASDMRQLQAAGTPEAQFAIDHFCYWAVRHAGSLVAAMGGLDAVVFTGGIGENDRVSRGRIIEGLAYLGAVPDAGANARNTRDLHDASSAVAIWTVPADEERQIALEALGMQDAR
jgi:acetate kinase